jgi:simple sugar transport system ATP-binding protein
MKIEINNIFKTFGEVIANSDVSLEINSGKIHALLGENGAGKSTLVKIISGHQKPDSGNITIDGNKLRLGSTKSSIENGIGILSQDPLDFQNLTVSESFLVGSKKFGPSLNKRKIANELNKIFSEYEVKVNPQIRIKSLSIGERQQVELARLLFENSKIIILDEPTNGFSLNQRNLVFKVLKKLNKNGYVIILVSHKLDEVFDLCNEATILKNGTKVKTVPIPFDRKKIIKLMFQEDISKIQNHSRKTILPKNQFISIDLSKWELGVTEIPQGSKIGVIGLQGSGCNQFIRDCFNKTVNISLECNGNNSIIPSEDFHYTPSDRLERGLFEDLTIKEHVALTYGDVKVIKWSNIEKRASSLIKEFEIKGESNSYAKQLSGGNQQKLQIALIPKTPGFLLLEQPTRGLDVKSTSSVWEKIIERSTRDFGILFSTTDIDEVWERSDWIICFSGEKITAVSNKSMIKKDQIKFLISGVKV